MLIKLDYTIPCSPSASQWPLSCVEMSTDLRRKNDKSDSWNWKVSSWIDFSCMDASSWPPVPYFHVIYCTCSMPQFTLIYRLVTNNGKNIKTRYYTVLFYTKMREKKSVSYIWSWVWGACVWGDPIDNNDVLRNGIKCENIRISTLMGMTKWFVFASFVLSVHRNASTLLILTLFMN